MSVLHFLRGPAPARLPPGNSVLIADDLTEGVLNQDRELNQLLRSAYLGAPLRDLEAVRQGLATLSGRDEVIVWSSPAPSDQLMLSWLVPLLRDLGIAASSLYLAAPLGQRGQAVALSEADRGAFTRGYMQRCLLKEEDEALLRRLWCALTAQTPNRLLAFQAEELGSLPFWNHAREGLLARYPDATGLGFHDRVLLAQCDFRWQAASSVIDSLVEESRPLAPLSRKAAWRRILRLAQGNGEASALLMRCSGPLAPEQCELALTELGYEASEGSADLLAHVQLCEWIGGTLLSSPDRVWRWTEMGLQRDSGNLQHSGTRQPAEARLDLLTRMRNYLQDRGASRILKTGPPEGHRRATS